MHATITAVRPAGVAVAVPADSIGSPARGIAIAALLSLAFWALLVLAVVGAV